MSKERTKHTPAHSWEEHELRLNEFLEGKITVTKFLAETSEDDPDLKDSVLALARRNMRQGKA